MIVDGDTVEMAGQRVRLFGIDAPEASQGCDRDGQRWACGEAASEHLRSLIGDYPLRCDGIDVDTYGRLVAVCMLSGVDVNRTMVAQGWAGAFRKYSDAYVRDEVQARAAQSGLWASTFVPPEQYRAIQHAETEPVARGSVVPSSAQEPEYSSSQCLIKGNRSRRGEWIYHLPGMPYYAETRPEEWFCSEAKARAAGYRKSRAH